MNRYRITIQRVQKEEYEMELEGENTMSAFDVARHMVSDRNRTTTDGSYSVIKIEDIKETT